MQKYPLSAHYVKNSLNLAKIEQKNADLPLFTLFRKERNLLVYKSSDSQYVCVYSFGVVVVCGIEDKKEIGKLIRRFAYGDEEQSKVNKVMPEEYSIVIDPDQPETVEFDYTRLKQLSPEKLLLIFHVVAQSVAIDYLEGHVLETLQRFEGFHNEMEQKGKLVAKAADVIKILGGSGNTVYFIINRLSLLDKPDITWEDKEAELLFTNLRKMFELDDRFIALRFKLQYIQDSSETILEALHTRRAEFLEIIVIVLILIEIIFMVPEYLPFFLKF